MDISSFTPEQVEKARACESPEELLELVKAEGVELSDEQLEMVSGGAIWDSNPHRVVYCCGEQIEVPEGVYNVVCPVCGAWIGIASS